MISTIILYLLFLCFLAYHFYVKRRKLPPGPLPFPLVGNLPQLFPGDPYDTLTRMVAKYGHTFTVWIGPKPFVVVCGYEQLKETMVHTFQTIDGRESNFFTEYLLGGKYGIFQADRALWQQHRRFSIRALSELGFGRKSGEQALMTELIKMQRDVEKKLLKTNVCSLDFNLQLCITNVMNSLLFGYTFEVTDPEFRHRTQLVSEQAKLFFALRTVIMIYCPILRFLPFFNSTFHQIKECQDSIHHFFMTEIQQHKDKFDPSMEPTDFIDMYLLEMHIQGENGNSLEHFSDFHLLCTCFDLWAAGIKTTVVTLRWALLYMMRFPEVQQKVQAEIDSVVTEEHVSYDERNKMPYTCATINEIQRYANIFLLNPPRETVEDCIIDGYTFPAKTALLLMTSQLHFDDTYFPEPKKFMPERFLDDNGKLLNFPQLVPFSMGKRSCMGMGVAKMELFVTLTNFLKKFKVSVPPGQPEPSLRRIKGLAVKPGKYECYIDIRK